MTTKEGGKKPDSWELHMHTNHDPSSAVKCVLVIGLCAGLGCSLWGCVGVWLLDGGVGMGEPVQT